MDMERLIEKKEVQNKREAEERLAGDVEKGNYAMMKVMLDRGVDPNAKGFGMHKDRTLLHIAADKGDAGAVLILLEAGTRFAEPAYNGDIPLHLACAHKNQLAAKLLIERCPASVNVENKNKQRPIHVAAAYGRDEVCQALVDAGADVNVIQRDWANWPLHQAAGNGHAKVCEILLKAGANLHAPNLHHKTPLFRAAESGHLDACRVLVAAGADADNRHHAGWGHVSIHSPCQIAVKNGHTDVVKFFLFECNSDPLSESGYKESLFNLAKGKPEILSVLRARETQTVIENVVMDAVQGDADVPVKPKRSMPSL